jgi:hypothetical protein
MRNQTFYGVIREFYENGTVKAAITSRACKEKPRNQRRITCRADCSINWFDTKEAAETFLAAPVAGKTA